MSDLACAKSSLGAVVIGRNEGARLIGCLESLKGIVETIVYVDSGSTDDSIAQARKFGAFVHSLDVSIGFSAARARNQGFKELKKVKPGVEYVQFIDGDCELETEWIEHGLSEISTNSEIAIVFGRRRERHPNASRWNRMIDNEWRTNAGDVKACGGDALIRCRSFVDVNGFREELIAGEEPEMCFRLRELGWRIVCIDQMMTIHDANMMYFSQWWQRCRRAGHTWAEGAMIHGTKKEKYRVKELIRTLLWGFFIPVFLFICGLVLSPAALLIFFLYPLQVFRMYRKGKNLEEAVFTVLGKFPEAHGAIAFFLSKFSKRRRGIIEYK